VAALKGLVLAIAAAFLLSRWYGADGIAAAIALGAWSMAFSLIRRGAATFGFSIDAAARRRLPRIVMAALAMGGGLWFAAALVWPQAVSAHGLAQAAILGMLIAASVTIYGLLLVLFGVVNRADAVDALKSSPP